MREKVSPCHCSCGNTPPAADKKLVTGARKTSKALPSILLSLLIAFFPKCPFCWAAYMSMFGTVGLARLPYMPWLLPLLMVLLGIHVFVQYKKTAKKGYLPFVVSLAGALTILAARLYFPAEKSVLIAGMLAIAAGSLLGHFMATRSAMPVYKTH